MSYKRNQVEEAIARIFYRQKPTSEFRTRIKRLLELDRSMGRKIRCKMLKRPILHSSARGSGSEVTPLGRAGAGSRHRKAVTVQQRVVDAHWSLGMALAWITDRSEQAVVGITHGRRAPTRAAIRDLLSALRSGKLIAHGMFEGERIPHPIETAVWSTFEIVLKSMIFADHTFLPTSGRPVVITQRMGPPHSRLLSATVPAAKVRKLWPAAKQTVAAEARCREYLVTQMKQSLDRAPKPKRDFLADCQARIPGLSKRGFERAWADAIRLTGAVGWSEAGRRRKSSR